MKPYYTHPSGITLYHGNSFAVLREVAMEPVDMILTDPPYGVNYSTNHRKGGPLLKLKLSNDGGGSASDDMLWDVLVEAENHLTSSPVLYCFAAPKRLDATLPIIKKHWGVTNILCWDKGNCAAGDLAGAYGAQWEAVIYARKKRVILKGHRDRDILRFSRGHTGAYSHPTQKPVALLEYLLGKHDVTNVLDPFVGSGSTLVAALRKGVKATGIELDESFCEITAKRLESETPCQETPAPQAPPA